MSRTKFTAPNREALIRYLEAGNAAQTACRMVGIDKTQFYRWLRKGEEARSGTFRQFYEDVQRATGQAEVRAMTILQTSMRDDPKWAAWYLERRMPEEYAKRERHEVTGAGGEPIRVELAWPQGPQPPT